MIFLGNSLSNLFNKNITWSVIEYPAVAFSTSPGFDYFRRLSPRQKQFRTEMRQRYPHLRRVLRLKRKLKLLVSPD